MSILQYLKEAEDQDITNKIIDFIMENPNPSDSLIHKFAEDNNFSPDVLETKIYSILTDVLTGGFAGKKGVTSKDVDAQELQKGIDVEKEHTSINKIAEIIALSHLAEDPKYYTKLETLKL